MDPNPYSQHLSHITTLWTLVEKARGPSGDTVRQAQRSLMERYAGAVHRYLLGALRDPHAADDLFQEFCLRFLAGKFANADPGRGRFRDYVKRALFHMLVDHQRARQKHPAPLPQDVEATAPDPEDERQFLDSWRKELLDRTWLALQDFERKTGQPHYTVLHLRAEQPLLSSEELARQVSARLGRPYAVGPARQALHRARKKFADLLLQEVARSLDDPSRARLEEELQDLELYASCREALRRRYGD
jgi:RNA polymerase sigma factor (sigma-70 family)